ALVNLATVVDSALTQLRAKLDAARVAVSRNYIGGPTVQADADKLRGVFANLIDNAIDALASVPAGRRIDLHVENGSGAATVRALKGLLAKEGYQVETAGSGEEAVKRIETGSFHLVITDLSMNGVGGMQVLEHARRVDPELAVIMITAYGSEKIAVQAMKLGA